MRLTDDIYASAAGHYKSYMTPAKSKTATSGAADPDEEPAVLLDLTSAARKKDEKNDSLSSIRAGKNAETKSSDVQDHSGRLTKRLVAAKSREEVQAILSEAYKNMGEVLRAAAGGDEKALEILKRLNKLIRRANRKVRDLTKEDELRRKEKKAKKDELEQLAKQLELELKQKQSERKKRERKYLRDVYPQSEKQRNKWGAHQNATLHIKTLTLMHPKTYSPPAIPSAPTEAPTPPPETPSSDS